MGLEIAVSGITFENEKYHILGCSNQELKEGDSKQARIMYMGDKSIEHINVNITIEKIKSLKEGKFFNVEMVVSMDAEWKELI